jgi:hypothetical protein
MHRSYPAGVENAHEGRKNAHDSEKLTDKISHALTGDELDDAVITADDTGMLASEKLITQAELAEGGVSPER